MIEFIDPRSSPEPPPRVSREAAAHGEELRELVGLCLAGRVYDVERWIQRGQAIQALTYKRLKKAAVLSPLQAAIRKKHLDLVLLFLCNGYRLDLEFDAGNSVLDEALSVGSFEILDLLLKWGAEPTKVSTENVIDTYKTELIERFWRAGVDYTADPMFVIYLAHTVNKPLYGWLRRNRAEQRLQDALDTALLEAVTEDKEKEVALLLWAGADPHRKVPDACDLRFPDAWDVDWLSSSAEVAISFGRHRLLDKLRIEAMPDLDAQVAHAHDTPILKKLVALRTPENWSETILSFIRRLCWRHGLGSSWDVRDGLKFIESNGGKLTTIAPDRLSYLRRELLEIPSADDFLWLLRWLRKEKNCEPRFYEELTRTAAVRKKLEALNAGERYLSPSQRMSRANELRRRAAERRKARLSGRGSAEQPAPGTGGA